MTIRYSELPANRPRPCRFCGSDTAPGQPGQDGSQQYFDEDPCNAHFESGMKEPGCIDCTVGPWYICGQCSGEAGQKGDLVSLDDIFGDADEPVH